MYKKIIFAFAMLLLFLPSCKKSDGLPTNTKDSSITLPSYSDIEVIPTQETYQVGDIITCRIEMTETGSASLDTAIYWFYADWWFVDPELKADFQEFTLDEETGKKYAISSPITLTEAAAQKTTDKGYTDLLFYGRLEYPSWDFRKVEIHKPIHVVAL